MTRTPARTIPWAWVSSLCIHGVIVACLTHAATGPREPRRAASVAFTVVSPARKPEVTGPPRTARNAAGSDRVPAKSRLPTPISRTKPTEPHAKEAALDLSGVTLTGGDGANWSSVTGNGLASDSPIRDARAGTPIGEKAAATPAAMVPAIEPPAIVATSELASKPAPPPLDARLLANYPRLAKQQGLGGSARLLVRIDADGIVRKCHVTWETSAEFGTACRQTLLGSRWSAPRDRQGRAVATQIHYTCDFRVNGS